jgi:chitinase
MLAKHTNNSLSSISKYLLSILLFICFSTTAKQPIVASYYVSAANPDAVSQLPADKLSHILYAFIALCGDNSGANETMQKAIAVACEGKKPYSAVIYNEKAAITEFAAFKKLKQQHPHLRVLPSFGGWTLSQPFHGMVRSESARKHFVQSAVDLIAKHDVFDGIDIDWEYPGGGGNSQKILKGADAQREKQVFTLMMFELREKLSELTQSTGKSYQLTAAVSGSHLKTHAIDWQTAIRVMDYVFVMTYDFAVGDGRAGHHTNLFDSNKNRQSTEGMINNLLQAKVPAHKLVVGVAFYGRGWTNSGWQGSGFSGSQNAISTGSYRYKELMVNPPKGFEYGYDAQSEAAYFYNAKTNGFISFDDPRSTKAKVDWARSKGLAGVFSWQIKQDNGELLDAMYQGMHSHKIESDTVDNEQ